MSLGDAYGGARPWRMMTRSATRANGPMSYFIQWRGRVLLIVASLSLLAPLLTLYWPAAGAWMLPATDWADFINVWSAPFHQCVVGPPSGIPR